MNQASPQDRSGSQYEDYNS
ncbi:hypothetical protein NPIL_217501, partial [Nephila pilipes]